MPTVPTLTRTRQPGSPNLGRIPIGTLPGTGESIRLRQIQQGARIGEDLASAFLARQEQRNRDLDALAISEADLEYKTLVEDRRIADETLRGPEVDGMTNRLREFMDTTRAQISANLTPEQSAVFERAVKSYEFNVSTRSSRSESTKHHNRIRSNYEGQIIASSTLAIDNAEDPEAFLGFVEQATQQKEARLKLDNIDENLIDGSVRQFKSDLITKGIRRVIFDSPAQAELMFKKAKEKKELTNKDTQILQTAITRSKAAQKKQSEDTQAQLITDQIFNFYGPDKQEVLEVIRNDTTLQGSLRDNVLTRAKARFKEEEDIEADTQSEMLTDFKNTLNQVNTYEEASLQLDQFRVSMDFDSQKKAEGLLKSRFLIDPAKKKTNLSKFQEARTNIDKTFLGDASKEERIRNVDDLISKYEASVKDSDMRILIDLYNKGGNISGLTETKSLATFRYFTENTAEEIRTDTNVKKEYHDFYRYMVANLEPGVKVTDVKLRELGSLYFTEGTGSGFPIIGVLGFGTSKTYGEALQENEALTWLPELNESMRKTALRIRNVFNAEAAKKGLPLEDDSDSNLSRLYKIYIQKLPHQQPVQTPVTFSLPGF
jgi:hypothetical protein